MKQAFKTGFGYMVGLVAGLFAANVALMAVDEKLPKKYKQFKKETEKKEA